jgi:peptidoglycan-N-acetylglucosamine deacetylase
LNFWKKITSKKIEYYRAPNFSLKNKWMLDCLIDNGIKLSSSIKNPIHHKGIRLPNKPFVFTKDNRSFIEFPLVAKYLIITKLAYSGSGYFRLLPFNMIKSMLSSTDYQMLYFHPRDFDSNVPTPKELGFIRNALNKIGTSSILSKLEKLSRHYSFISISQALELIKKEDFEIIEY